MTRRGSDPAADAPVQDNALGYAPAPPRRREWARRALVGVVPLLGVVALLLWGYVPARDKVTFLLQQDRCFRFSPAPDTVAYTEDPATVARLTGGALSGNGWATLSQNFSPIAYYLAPDALRHLEQTPGVNIPQGSGPVFLHGRRAARGEERLVVVKIDQLYGFRVPQPTDAGWLNPFGLLRASVMRPATLFSRPRITLSRMQPDVPMPGFGELTLYAGRADPADDAHFTIDYRTPAGRGTIDGWLQSDDTVTFQVRDGPLRRQQTNRPSDAPYNRDG